MKNSVYLLTFISSLTANYIISCPQGFSSQDRRPFFEQYEIEDKPEVEKIEKEEQ